MRFWVLLSFYTACLACFGQDSKPFELRLAIGVSPEIEITKEVDSAFVFKKSVNKLVYSAEISNQILDRFEFSAMLGYHKVPFEVLNGNIQEEYGNYYKIFLSLRGKYEYLQKEAYSIYSGLGLGYSYMIKRGKIPNVPGSTTNKTYTEDRELLIQPNISILLIGSEYQLNEKIKFYSELNLGAPYAICIGVGYQI